MRGVFDLEFLCLKSQSSGKLLLSAGKLLMHKVKVQAKFLS